MILFVGSSILLGIGLAMDAFSISIANGLNEPDMKRGRRCLIAGTYGFFQLLMPVIGWFCVHMLVHQFRAFEPFIPWIALGLLLYIGGKMIRDAVREGREEKAKKAEKVKRAGLSMGMLLLQGMATSIDALSTGFAIADYGAGQAVCCALIIAVVTFLICLGGLHTGRRIGERVSGKAGILGGCILIFIGLEIFIRGVIL